MKPKDAGDIGEEGELFATHIGGSATIEGVMMRGRLSWAVAVRCPDGGIYVEEHDLAPACERPAWTRLPIVRGCVSFAESMLLSYRALDIASAHAYEDELEDEADGQTGGADAPVSGDGGEGASGSGLSGAEFACSIGIGLIAGLGLFIGLPVLAATVALGPMTAENSLGWNLIEAAVRIVLLVAYVGGVGLIPDMARLYGYHGAEHQAIHCFEHGAALTPENAARFSRLHVRCGTAFLVMTVAVSLIVHAVVPVGAAADALGLAGVWRNLFVLASRLAMVPLVAGASWEVTVKWAGAHPSNPLVKVALWPGMQMQRLTTRKADACMLECAIAALQRVDARERAGLGDREDGANAA